MSNFWERFFSCFLLNWIDSDLSHETEKMITVVYPTKQIKEKKSTQDHFGWKYLSLCEFNQFCQFV